MNLAFGCRPSSALSLTRGGIGKRRPETENIAAAHWQLSFMHWWIGKKSMTHLPFILKFKVSSIH